MNVGQLYSVNFILKKSDNTLETSPSLDIPIQTASQTSDLKSRWSGDESLRKRRHRTLQWPPFPPFALLFCFSFAFPPDKLIHWSLSCCKAVTLTVFSSLFLTVHPLDPAPVLQQYPTSTHSIPSFLPSLLFFLLLSLFLSQVSDMDPKSYDAKSTWSNSTYRPKN